MRNRHTSTTRRQFLGQANCAAVSSIPVLNTLLNLSLAERVAAVTAPAESEYRALVCIFLSGGNDSFNMLVPREQASKVRADDPPLHGCTEWSSPYVKREVVGDAGLGR